MPTVKYQDNTITFDDLIKLHNSPKNDKYYLDMLKRIKNESTQEERIEFQNYVENSCEDNTSYQGSEVKGLTEVI